MPMGVTKKQERQYEHIKDSYEERGVSTDEAKERAARTVNKQKSKSKGRSPEPTGPPVGRPPLRQKDLLSSIFRP